MTFQSWLSSQAGPDIKNGPQLYWDEQKIQQEQNKRWGKWDRGGRQGSMPDINDIAWHGNVPYANPDYFQDMQGQYDAAQGFLMDQTGPGGMLSESSMNPYTRQLAEGSAYAERERQSDMGYGLASAGVNPLMAQRVIGEGNQYATEQLGTQFAGFQQDLQQRQFDAGAGLTNLGNALNSEMTARREDQWRWTNEWLLSDKHNTAMAKAAEKGATKDLYGAGFSFAGDVVGAAIGLSDVRMKKNLKRIGEHPIGVGVWEFSYKWEDDSVKHIGLLADEVQHVRPEALLDVAGFKAIDYSKL